MVDLSVHHIIIKIIKYFTLLIFSNLTIIKNKINCNFNKFLGHTLPTSTEKGDKK